MKKRHKRAILIASTKPGTAVVFHQKLTESKKIHQQVERMNKLKLEKVII